MASVRLAFYHIFQKVPEVKVCCLRDLFFNGDDLAAD